MPMVCHLPGCDGHEYPGTTTGDFLRHQRDVHLAVDIPTLNTWRDNAIAEVTRLAATGKPFQLWEAFAVAGDAPDHRTAHGKFASEIEDLGLAHVCGYGKSTRPDSKSSAVAIWAGGPKPRQENVA